MRHSGFCPQGREYFVWAPTIGLGIQGWGTLQGNNRGQHCLPNLETRMSGYGFLVVKQRTRILKTS